MNPITYFLDFLVDGAFEGRFRISSETWVEALSDEGSPMYRSMSAKILEELKKIYSADDLKVTIFGFEAGSIIVKFRCQENRLLCIIPGTCIIHTTYMHLGTGLVGYSDTLGTWGKCHCN